MTSMASSMVTIPTKRCSSSTIGIARKSYLLRSPETRRSVNEILKYPEDSAGSIMTTEFVDLKRDLTVADAGLSVWVMPAICSKSSVVSSSMTSMASSRRTGVDKETINICYVTDTSRRLLGLVSIRTRTGRQGILEAGDYHSGKGGRQHQQQQPGNTAFHRLLGLVSIRTLLLADQDDVIEDIMETNVVSASTMDDREDVAQDLSKYDFLAMPIVALK